MIELRLRPDTGKLELVNSGLTKVSFDNNLSDETGAYYRAVGDTFADVVNTMTLGLQHMQSSFEAAAKQAEALNKTLRLQAELTAQQNAVNQPAKPQTLAE